MPDYIKPKPRPRLTREQIISIAMAAGASDGVFFREAGIPTYGVGEAFIKESDDFSHGLNERIPVQSFYDGLVHWRVLINDLAGRR